MPKYHTHYDNLQVTQNASIEVIRAAYKSLAQKWHPDKHPNNKEYAERIMQIINEAYAVLSDPTKRKEHDEWIHQQQEIIEENLTENTTEKYNHGSRYDSEPASNNKQEHESSYKQEQTTNSKPEGNIPNTSKNFFGGIHHPWRRYFARTVDIFTSGILVFVIFNVLLENFLPQQAQQFNKTIENDIIAGFVLYVLWIPFEALFLSYFTTTPAKWVFGIFVLKNDGSKLLYLDSLNRSFLVWVQGLGFGIPIITIFTNFFSYKRLTKTGTTLWDKEIQATVFHKEWGVFRSISVTIVTIFTFIIINLFITINKNNLSSQKTFSEITTSQTNPSQPEYENKSLSIKQENYSPTIKPVELTEQEYYEQSQKLFNNNDWIQLERLCFKWVIKYPYNSQGWNLLGIAYMNINEFDKSIEAYKKALELSPGNKVILDNLEKSNVYKENALFEITAKEYFDNKEWFALENYCVTWTKKYKNNPVAWNYLGLAYHNNGKYDKSLEAYKKALEFAPGNNVIKENIQAVQYSMQNVNGNNSNHNKPLNSRSPTKNCIYKFSMTEEEMRECGIPIICRPGHICPPFD